jgi:hypothetical protein
MSHAMNFDHLVELCRLKHEGMQPTPSVECMPVSNRV